MTDWPTFIRCQRVTLTRSRTNSWERAFYRFGRNTDPLTITVIIDGQGEARGNLFIGDADAQTFEVDDATPAKLTGAVDALLTKYFNAAERAAEFVAMARHARECLEVRRRGPVWRREARCALRAYRRLRDLHAEENPPW